jgi:hypothetical protein
VVLQKKPHDTESCVPIQGVYEPMLPESATDRYQLVVDGEYYSGRRARYVTREITDVKLNQTPAIDIARHLGRRIVRRLKRAWENDEPTRRAKRLRLSRNRVGPSAIVPTIMSPTNFLEKLIPTTIIAALEDRPILVYGRGANIRDWLHVDDHVQALVMTLERGTIGQTYAVGSNAEISNIDRPNSWPIPSPGICWRSATSPRTSLCSLPRTVNDWGERDTAIEEFQQPPIVCLHKTLFR